MNLTKQNVTENETANPNQCSQRKMMHWAGGVDQGALNSLSFNSGFPSDCSPC